METRIKAVLFDQDGLMFDTERVSAQAWKRAGDELGVDMGEHVLRHFRGRRPEECSELYTQRFGTKPGYWEIRKRKQRYFIESLEREGLPVKKGLLELVAWLFDHGYPMALATASPRDWSLSNLEAAGVRKYFDALVCGDMVTRSKPDPEIFYKAAGELGFCPGECLVLEDSLNGVAAALNGGFPVIMVPDLTEPDEELAGRLTAKCVDLLEVKKMFEDNRL